MYDDDELDKELATFTDRTMAGDDAEVPPGLQDLAQVVRQVYHTVAPDRHPALAFRDRLTQRLNREWTLQYERSPQRGQPRQITRLIVMAAGVVAALVLVALLLKPDAGSGSTIRGTALGSVAWAFVIVVALAGLGLILWWYRQRR
jgi:hypothetical protein